MKSSQRFSVTVVESCAATVLTGAARRTRTTPKRTNRDHGDGAIAMAEQSNFGFDLLDFGGESGQHLEQIASHLLGLGDVAVSLAQGQAGQPPAQWIFLVGDHVVQDVDHPDGGVAAQQPGDGEKARKVFSQAMKQIHKSFGPNHFYTATVLAAGLRLDQ